MDQSHQIDDARVHGALRRLLALGRDQRPVMREIQAIGEASTRERFRTETGPDGKRWAPSLRAQLSGGRTLTQDGHLADSISGSYGSNYAEWGVNRIYAAIQQFGGTIRAKTAGALRFTLANGQGVSVQSVTLPARPYLGISDDNAEDILDVIERRIDGAAHAG